MEDKRVIKSKQTMRSTFIGLLSEMPFEKITVTELCRRGLFSRITFYAHYNDKYGLADEIFTVLTGEGKNNFKILQKERNPDDRGDVAYMNLLEAILLLYSNNIDFFKHLDVDENPYLHSVYLRKLLESVENFMRNRIDISLKYPYRETAAFLCGGLYAVINSCVSTRTSRQEAWQTVRSMYADLLDSKIFGS